MQQRPQRLLLFAETFYSDFESAGKHFDVAETVENRDCSRGSGTLEVPWRDKRVKGADVRVLEQKTPFQEDLEAYFGEAALVALLQKVGRVLVE